MGTNFYHRYNICSECERHDERHIGKRSSGWQFSFRGYNDDEGRLIIASWQDWKNVLTGLKQGKIFDEYRKEIEVSEFIEMVEKTKGKQNHYDYLRKSPHYGPSYLSDMWKDSEGWDFTSGEFS
jgi:hypothetical protein